MTHTIGVVTLAFRLNPPDTPVLRSGLLQLWADVSNAGGAVGFVPPVTTEDIRPALNSHFQAVHEGQQHVLVGYTADEEVAAAAFFTLNAAPMLSHWLWLFTVMVHPQLQGAGHGRDLMMAAENTARLFDGTRAIRLSCRSGLGLEDFYAACGYKEVGRIPNAIQVAPGDYRDEIVMLLPLGTT